MKVTFLKGIMLLLGLTCFTACNNEDIPEFPPETDIPSEPIDYSLDENWLLKGKDNHFDVDVFYFYPTAYFPAPNQENPPLFCEIDNKSMHLCAPAEYILQAKIFDEMANVYIPWYRQSDCFQILGKSPEQIEAIERLLPYKDAMDAFDYYIKNLNQGRPFIITSDSQGSIIAKMVMEDYMRDHPEVLERMIVAYPLGYSFEKSYFEKNPHLKFAEGETDTGVIACWNCERKENGEFAEYNYICFQGALCINPITWKRDHEIVPAGDPRYLGCKQFPHLDCSVQIQYDPDRDLEVLILGIDTDIYDLEFIGDKNLHRMDYSYFNENLKANAKKRIETFMKTWK